MKKFLQKFKRHFSQAGGDRFGLFWVTLSFVIVGAITLLLQSSIDFHSFM